MLRTRITLSHTPSAKALPARLLCAAARARWNESLHWNLIGYSKFNQMQGSLDLLPHSGQQCGEGLAARLGSPFPTRLPAPHVLAWGFMAVASVIVIPCICFCTCHIVHKCTWEGGVCEKLPSAFIFISPYSPEKNNTVPICLHIKGTLKQQSNLSPILIRFSIFESNWSWQIIS